MTTTRLCIVRHGETHWNTERRIQGHLDIELNVNGLGQAEATARGIADHEFSALYSSDLMRTVQTAAILGRVAGLSVHEDEGLRERHYGRMQGMTYEEMLAQDVAEAERFRQRDPFYDFGAGETLLDFADRIHGTVERLVSAHAGQTLLLVTTGRGLSAPRDFVVPNAALNWLEVGAEGWRLLSWADRQHLEVVLEQSVE